MAVQGKNILGKRIQALRKAAKPRVSQEDLVARLAARGIYLDRTGLARIENEDRFLRDYEIEAIAKALKVPVADLFKRGSYAQ
ncbi:MAG: hypothetical protein B9S32_04170 [Verrucomicrobia bacterium Tous-C9LFEB]|nr:MAG: hypothetical protein B9S32_04170 [Verrucomicrobia bacterium Tous-C9LFEB]